MAKSRLRPDWTSLLLAEEDGKVICIRKPGQAHWQFPGGKRHLKDRDSRITAVRETREETGVRVHVGTITLVGSSVEYNHHTHRPFRVDFYRTSLTKKQIASHFVISKEGEEVGVFTWEELGGLGDKFSPFHRMLAERFGMWQ